MEAILMRKVLITQLVQQANEAIKPIHYSASTVYQYNLAWNRLAQFFSDNGTIHYSEELANRFVEESKCELVNDKEWRYKLYRLSVCILTEVYETGAYKWRFHSKDPNRSLKMELQKIHRTYSQKLIQSGKGSGTCDCYEVVARQFLKYLQEELHIGTEELQLSDISGFIPYLAKLYQMTSMRTALSALRSFLTFLYQEGYSMVNLLPAVPSPTFIFPVKK
jgi:hypothetical protein